MLRAHDPRSKRHVLEFVQRQSLYRVHYISSGIRNCAAANACEDLGEKAKPAVPALVELLKSEDAYVRSAASAALKRIDPEAATKAGVE
jgi:HEAT repeat protein